MLMKSWLGLQVLAPEWPTATELSRTTRTLALLTLAFLVNRPSLLAV
ncbi:hypothetical protein LT85_0723 [Collimonas arenae]|uniref:Uncharacterized protein n=1 Tax=Collimonas arenae TaxID=279058 RepID=A0A0A1F5A0_9BURK|nr:hypothetical protein LT85_0723 [Collimonas arenae]